MSSIFKKQFERILIEQDDLEGPPPGVDGDEEALVNGLDSDTPPEAFNDVPDNPAGFGEAGQVSSATTKLNQWITQIEDFIEHLNGLQPSSMNYELNRADCSSIMADVQRSESKKISRVAQDLSSLGEALKQYLLGAERKAREAAVNSAPQGNI
tara:strand:- start:3631 stop:4092 length:462 start_codon:yes stop_codon:yes gene_type:complete